MLNSFVVVEFNLLQFLLVLQNAEIWSYIFTILQNIKILLINVHKLIT